MKSLITIAIILLSLIGVSAQETTITKEVFDKMMADSYETLRNVSYRTTEESEMQSEMGGVTKNKIVSERAGVNYHTISEFDTPSFFSKTETILVDGKRFTKKLNNPWRLDAIDNKPHSSDTFETISNETFYKYIGEKTTDNKKLKVYRTISTRVTVIKESGFQSKNIETVTYYFDETGFLAKTEANIESTYKAKDDEASGRINKETKSTSKIIKTYEIDSSIKINAPQIS